MGKALEQVNKNKIRVISSYLVVILIIISGSSVVFGLTVNSNSKEEIQKLSYTILFEKPNLNEIELNGKIFTQIDIKNCFSHAEPGDPSLPIHPIKILLPQGKKISKIDVSYIDSIKINCNLIEKPIVPQQMPIAIGIENSDASFRINAAAYSSSKPVFKKLYDDVDISYCRGYAILSIMLNPVQYIPSNGKMSYYPEMTVNIELEKDESINQYYRNNLADEEWVSSLVINPEETTSYGTSNLPTGFEYSNGLCDPSVDYDYVIITTTAGGLNDWATSGSIPYNWTSLMDKHSSEDGLSCNLVLVEDITNCSDYWNDTALFNDTPAKIREFCKDAYQDWNTSYILIGGDDDIIPAREMDYAFESDVEADIYWNHLDNSFNADQDSYWGEAGDGGFDLYTEMYIGRLPCDVPQDVSNWMNKSFTYADSISSDYLENAAFYGGNTGWDAEGDDFVEYSAIQGTSNWLGPVPGAHGSYPSWIGFQYGFETWNAENPNNPFNLSVKWTAEPTNAGWSGGSEAAAITGLKNAINADNVTLLSGIAHANEYMSLDVSSSNWESLYHNTKPFFIHDYGCHCGDMDAADDGVLHSMLFHSDTELAFACVYNTGYGWGSYSDTNSSSALQQKLFWDYLFDLNNNSISTSNWQLGKAMAFSKDAMAPTINWTYAGAPGSWRCTIQSCLLFGDPAQKLKSPSQNITLSNESPSNSSTTLSPGNLTLEITVCDAQQDTMNITFRTNETGDWQDIDTNESQLNGAYSQTYIFSNYDMKYWWSVNVSDLTGSSGWTNETYHFTTRSQYIPITPGSFTATSYNCSRIELSWSNVGLNDTYIEWNATETWARGEGNLLDNSSTNTSYQHTGLNFNTIYYYQAWSWNITDNCWSTSYTSTNNTTQSNSVPILSNASPSNGSTGQLRWSSCNVTVSDVDNDSLTVYFFENTTGSWVLQQTNDSNSGDNVIWVNFTNASNFLTKYYWSVNITDGYNWTNETYYFTTADNQPPSFSSISPANESTGVSISLSTLSLTISDPEDDLFNWTITTSPNIGSNSGTNKSTGSKSCSISGLGYSTTYYWYVSALDTGNGTWSNATYKFATEEEQVNPGGGGYTPPAIIQNNAPSTPSLPDGPSSGYPNTSYNYSTTSTDSDGDQIKYKFDWGDGTQSDWSDFIDSGIQISLSHSWSSSGTYNVKAQSKDENNAESSWSELLSVTITDQPETIDDPEDEQIIINIPDDSSANNSVIFDFVEINGLDDENITYYWDFGDGNTGTEKQPNHLYNTPGIYTVTLAIYDTNGLLINTTTFEITISEDSSSEVQTSEEATSQNKIMLPLWALLAIGGIIVLSLLLVIFRKKIFASSKYDYIDVDEKYQKGIKVKETQFQEFRIGPKRAPPNMLEAYYDHDIAKIRPEQNIQQPYDINYEEDNINKSLKNHHKKPAIKHNSKENNEK